MGEDDRASVRTYVPVYQKEEWAAHAEELDMSLSEFVRTMVQAGRSGFGVADDGRSVEPDPSGPTPGGNGLEEALLEHLARDGAVTWDDLLDVLTADMEDRLDETLERLQEENRVTHSGRDGGYTLTDE